MSSSTSTQTPLLYPVDQPSPVMLPTTQRTAVSDRVTSWLEDSDMRGSSKHEEHYMRDSWGNEVFSDDFFTALLSSVSRKEAERYLEYCGHYDRKNHRWTTLPVIHDTNKKRQQFLGKFSKSLESLMTSIFKHFKCEKRVSVASVFRESVRYDLEWKEGLLVSSFGGSISEQQNLPDDPSFRDSISPWQVGMDHHFNRMRTEISTRAGQMFSLQYNRRFVFGVAVSDKRLQVHLIDRMGALSTGKFNYHANPVKFVQLVAFMGITNQAALGFDTSVWWDRAGNQFINVFDDTYPKKVPTTFRILKPYFRCSSLKGRGTACWTAIDEDDVITEETVPKYFIKDAWREAGRVKEGETLHQIRKLVENDDESSEAAGAVVKLQVYGDIRIRRKPDDVWNNRGKLGKPIEERRNRIHTRIVTQYVGPTLDHFKSDLQLIQAFLDAVKGLRWLYERGLLHRDVSVWNIFITEFNEDMGARGVMGDYDHSTWVKGVKSSELCRRSGTRPFQSENVLSSGKHTFIDDLQSCYFVMCWIVTGYKAPGEEITPNPFEYWGTAQMGVRRKAAHFTSLLQLPITAYFKGPITNMITKLHRLFSLRKLQSVSLLLDHQPPPDWERLGAVRDDDVCYAKFIEIVEEAGKELIARNLSDAQQPEIAMKHEREEDVEEQGEEKGLPPAKRQRIATLP